MNLTALVIELKMGTPTGKSISSHQGVVPCSQRGAEPPEGGWIALTWIADPRFSLVYQCLNDDVDAGGTVVATEGRFVKILVSFVDNTCQALLPDQLVSCGKATRL